MVNNSFRRVSKPISRLIKTGVLDDGDMAAVMAIEAGVISILTNDIHSTRHDQPRSGFVPGGAEENFMRSFEARQLYYDWSDAMQVEGLPAGPVLDIILEGKPLNRIDKAWCRRKGWSRDILIKSLVIYRTVAQERSRKRIRLTA